MKRFLAIGAILSVVSPLNANLFAPCEHPSLKDEPECQAARAAYKKVSDLADVFVRVSGNATSIIAFDFTALTPIDGVLLDWSLSLYLDASEADRPARELELANIVSHYARPTLRIIFQRYVRRLTEEALANLQKMFAAKRKLLQELKEMEAFAAEQLSRSRSELEATSSASAAATERFQAVINRFGPVRSVVLEARDRRVFTGFRPFAKFREIEQQVTSLVEQLASCPEEEIKDRQKAVVDLIAEQQRKGLNAQSTWQLTRRAYTQFIDKPTLRDEARRLERETAELRKQLAEDESSLAAAKKEVNTITAQLALVS